MTASQGGSGLVSLRGIRKSFGGQYALAGVDLDLRAGEVHALVGQNGCGKSTLIKLLAGFHQPGEGSTATLRGEPFGLGDPRAAETAGFSFVHQDLGLVDGLTVTENLALRTGYRRGRLGSIAWRRQHELAASALRRVGYPDIAPERTAGELRTTERVGVAIARALGPEGSPLPSLLVLDEPTAAMPGPEVEELLRAVRRVSEQGVAVLYVSHRLEEVLRISTRVTVLRDGTRVATVPTAELDHDGLVELIVGSALAAAEHVAHEPSGDLRLRVSGLAGTVVRDVGFEVTAGEVVGVAGVTGSGREEIAALVAGAERPGAGTVELDGRVLDSACPAQRLGAGLAFVPAERLRQAIVPTFTVGENVTVSGLRRILRFATVRPRAERREVERWISALGIVPGRADASILTLSGGNQQKAIFARELRREPRLLVLDEPTQGVDVGASAEIHRLVAEAAAGGCSVLVCSTDNEELVRLCDRVYVLCEGRVTAHVRGAALTTQTLEHEVLRPVDRAPDRAGVPAPTFPEDRS